MTSRGEALLAWAKGSYADEAAVRMLLAHGRYDSILDAYSVTDDGVTWLDWEALREDFGSLGLSGGERRYLSIALSLVNCMMVSLNDAVSGLDRAHLDLALAAIAHAAGSHEHTAWVQEPDGTIRLGTPTGDRYLSSLHPWPEEG